ncbi:type II toxin-antitoxin system VapC family toxin [Pararhizobium sp. O133]|uniref:type II toxin-antitoxin system VapC family toxin n=1 Tax=Pararhizobium sp. O133 TaxID=3449278 RepID=UPI003F687DB4
MSTEVGVHDKPRPLLLLDTSVLTLRARQDPPAGLRDWLDAVAGVATLCICFPVLVEFRRGLNLCKDPLKAARIRHEIEEIERTDFVYFSLGRATELVYARMLSIPALKHFWNPNPNTKHQRVSHDLMIAATAVSYDTPIVSTDSDFKVIDGHVALPGVFDPLKGEWKVAPRTPIWLPPLVATCSDAGPHI